MSAVVTVDSRHLTVSSSVLREVIAIQLQILLMDMCWQNDSLSSAGHTVAGQWYGKTLTFTFTFTFGEDSMLSSAEADGKTPFVQVCKTWALACMKTVRQRKNITHSRTLSSMMYLPYGKDRGGMKSIGSWKTCCERPKSSNESCACVVALNSRQM